MFLTVTQHVSHYVVHIALQHLHQVSGQCEFSCSNGILQAV